MSSIVAPYLARYGRNIQKSLKNGENAKIFGNNEKPVMSLCLLVILWSQCRKVAVLEVFNITSLIVPILIKV